MEPGLTSGPSPRLERAVLWLLPPVVREEVAGDLWERYRHPAQYLADTLRILPHVVWSQMRRATDLPLFLLLALTVLVAHGGLEPDRGTVIGVPIAQRALVATLFVLAAQLLRNAYRPSESWTAHRAIGDVVGLLVGLAGSQILLTLLAFSGLIAPTWRLPLGWMLAGFFFYSVMLLILRSELEVTNIGDRPGEQRPERDVMSDFHRYQRNLRLGAVFELGGLVLLGILIAWLAVASRPIVTIVAGSWAAVTAALILWRLARERVRPLPADQPERMLAAFRQELARRLRTSRLSWWWCFVPLFAGLAYNTIAFGVATAQPLIALAGIAACAGLALMIHRLGQRRKLRLGAKIAQLEEAEGALA